jgi:UDP-N-acetylmuramate-alanine ligase
MIALYQIKRSPKHIISIRRSFDIIESGDVVLTLGAGDIHTLVKPIITQYANS